MSKGGVFLRAAIWVVSPHMPMKLSVLSPANLPIVTLLSRLEPSGEEETLMAWEGGCFC